MLLKAVSPNSDKLYQMYIEKVKRFFVESREPLAVPSTIFSYLTELIPWPKIHKVQLLLPRISINQSLHNPMVCRRHGNAQQHYQLINTLHRQLVLLRQEQKCPSPRPGMAVEPVLPWIVVQ